MKFLFVLFGLTRCTLIEVDTLFTEFETLHDKVTTATNNSYKFIEEKLSEIEKEKSFVNEQSKSKICEFLNNHCKKFIFSTHNCACNYLKDIHTMLVKHISDIRSENIKVEYINDIRPVQRNLMYDNTSFKKCTELLENLGATNNAYALSEIIAIKHKLVFMTAESHFRHLNLQHLDCMKKGKELADKILLKLGQYIRKNNSP